MLALTPAPRAMGEYRLSRLAERQLLDIHADSEDMFGRYQADAYLAGLDRTFGLLSDFPLMGPSADEILPKLRRFRFQSHFIFYMPEADFVFVRGILHVRMNIRAELFE